MSERFVCSAASVERGEGVVATASQVRAWLLIEVHGAWGADAIEDSHLGVHVPEGWKHGLKLRGIRPVCIRPPDHGPEPDHVRVYFVTAARPGRAEGATWTRTVPLAAVRYLTDDLRAGVEPKGWERHDERIVIVCTNGKHDQCCATQGRPVVRHLKGTRWAEQVWQCSHIGGDRFAANLVVLPDSLYFGRMTPEEAEAILDAHAEGDITLDRYRGRSTSTFPEQAAEHAIRTALDVRGNDAVTMLSGPPDRAGIGGAQVTVRAEVHGIGTFEVVVTKQTEPLDDPLTCNGPAGQRIPVFTTTPPKRVTTT